MSRIGKQPIILPKEVKIEIRGQQIKIAGPRGELKYTLPAEIVVKHEDDTLKVERNSKSRQSSALWGLWRSLLQNAVLGVVQGYEKELELVGMGFRVEEEGRTLKFSLGFSHPINFTLPENIQAEIQQNVVKISGFDKQLVGQVAANIRKLFPPEPYKGKGIRYKGEVVRRKAGKAAKAVGVGAGQSQNT